MFDLSLTPARSAVHRRGGLGNSKWLSTIGRQKLRRPIFSRLLRNIGWLLGGQGLAGLFGLMFLAICAKSLGPAHFGLFTIALTYGQLFSNLSHFESWKGVIRFGALHLANKRQAQLARLLGFSGTLVTHGGAATVLRARVARTVIYLLLLMILLPLAGATGANIAAVISSMTIVGTLAFAARRMIVQKEPRRLPQSSDLIDRAPPRTSAPSIKFWQPSLMLIISGAR